MPININENYTNDYLCFSLLASFSKFTEPKAMFFIFHTALLYL